jgi:hypothetical protein
MEREERERLSGKRERERGMKRGMKRTEGMHLTNKEIKTLLSFLID